MTLLSPSPCTEIIHITCLSHQIQLIPCWSLNPEAHIQAPNPNPLSDSSAGPYLPVTTCHHRSVCHLQTVSMEGEQPCKEEVPREVEAWRELCPLAAESPAVSSRELQTEQPLSCPEKHAGQMSLCPAWLSTPLTRAA